MGTVTGLPEVDYGGQGGFGDVAFLESEAGSPLSGRTIYLSWAEAGEGDTLMSAAVANGVPGIDGDCGGSCACATCHIYVPDKLTGGMEDGERDMLSIADDTTANSRLGCQIPVTEALDGLRVQLPGSQH